MKKLIIASLLLIGTQASVWAQTQKPTKRPKADAEQRIERRADMLEQALDLSPDQKEAMLQVDRKAMDEVKHARLENRNEVQMIRQKTNEEYKKILTEEQYTKYEELKKKRKAKMGQREK